MVFFVAVGALLSPDPEQTQAIAAPPVGPAPSECRTTLDDPVLPALLRANGWVPWDDLLAELSAYVEGWGELSRVDFRQSRGDLEIAGETSQVHKLAELMLFLEEYPWLENTMTEQVSRKADLESSTFVIRTEVHPQLRLEWAR